MRLSLVGFTVILVAVMFCGVDRVSADCVDMPSCSNVPQTMCTDPVRMDAIRQNCKALCGLCPKTKHMKKLKQKTKRKSGKIHSKKQKPMMQKPQQREQCVDKPNCVNWVRNGYCDSAYRTEDEKRQNCPNACKLCNPNKPNNNQPSNNPMSAEPYELFAHSLDESVKPCDDFYKFACGKYQKENPPKNGQSFSRFIDHTRLIEEQLMKTVFSKDSSKSKAVDLMRKFRDSCMNTQAIEADQTTTLQADLKTMGEIPMLAPTPYLLTNFKLTDTLINMNKLSGHNFLFDIELANDPRGQPILFFSPSNLIIKNPADYTDPAQTNKINALTQFIAEVMTQIGNDMSSARTFKDVKAAVDAVVALEKQLAQVFIDERFDDDQTMATTLQNPKKMSDFANLLKNAKPNFQVDLATYLQQNILLADPAIQALIATDPPVFIHNEAVFQKIMPILITTGKEQVFIDYLFVKYVLKQLGYLDSRFSASANRFAYKLDGSTHSSTREQDCFEMVRTNFPLALDHQYNAKFLTPQAQESAEKIMSRMKEGFGTLIKRTKWLDSPDQQYAIRKLSAVKEKIGEIDEAKSRKKLDAIYAGLSFDPRDKFIQMAKKVAEAKGKLKYEKLVKANSFKYDKTMSADYIGTNFIREQNELFVPAAILQAPLLNTSLPASLSYGALGFLYGFGLSHGFDDLGRRYDLNGVERSWWDKTTKKAYKKKKQCLVGLYDGLTEPVTGQNVDGSRTLRENIADSGAIRSAFEAYKAYETSQPQGQSVSVPGYQKYTNEQIFFMGYATMMCSSMSQNYQNQLMERESFAPSQFRVNTVLSNYDEFAKAFKCQASDPMVDKQMCSVW